MGTASCVGDLAGCAAFSIPRLSNLRTDSFQGLGDAPRFLLAAAVLSARVSPWGGTRS